MASNQPPQDLDTPQPEDDDLLDADEVGEEIEEDDDHPMDDEDDAEIQEEIAFQNDSIAHFDAHTDSIFCIAQHPTQPNIIATGGGDDVAYIYDATVQPGPVLPSSYQSDPTASVTERSSLPVLKKLEGHTDSVNAITFTQPDGKYLLTAGLDGKLRAHHQTKPTDPTSWTLLTEATEVEEINWLSANPSPTTHPNIIALGASDGSVWVYKVDAADKGSELSILMTQYLHTGPCTAGAWTPDGAYLATVSEDSSLHVFDVFGTGQPIISLTSDDQRFEVEGGLYAVAATTSLVAVGGAGGNIRVIGLPQPSAPSQSSKKSRAPAANSQAASAGQILASLTAQGDSIESLSFSAPPLTLLASASVDSSIALFDTAHRFALRRHIRDAHEGEAVVKVEFMKPLASVTGAANSNRGYVLTSAGMDGVLRRWDVRGGTTAAGQGFLKEWRGHRGGGEGGGILGFVQGGRDVITAGDDGVSLVFKGDV